MNRFIVVFVCVLLTGVHTFSFAQDTENKIIISNKEESYTFALNKKGEEEVRAGYVATYRCQSPGVASVVEFYDSYGEIRNVKVKGIKGVTPKYGMYNRENVFFSDSRACYFDIPFITKGSEAIVSVDKTYKDIRHFNYIFLAEVYYIDRKTVKVTLPDWMHADILLKNTSGNITRDSIRNEAEGTTTHLFYVKNQAEVVKETNSTGYRYSYPYILIVPRESIADGKKKEYFKTVDHLYQWYREPVMSLNNDEHVIHAKATDLLSGCDSGEDKIRELCKWVQQSIRYIAFQDGISAFRPDEAREVMDKKYGDCKGMSNLLKALLVSVGFDARLAWVSAGAKEEEDLDPQTPVPFADHMICSLFWNDSLYFIDPTVRSLSFGEIPENIQGRKVLIEDGKDYIISTIPSRGAGNNRDSLFIQYTMTGSKLSGTGSRYFEGESKHHILYWMDRMKETDRSRMLEEFIKNEKTQDTVSELMVEGLETLRPEVYIRYNVSRESALNVLAGRLIVDMEECKDYQDAKIDLSKRKTALKFPYKDYVVRVSEFTVPDEYAVVHLPLGIELVRDKYVFILTYGLEGNKIIYHKEISLLSHILEREEMEQWNSDIDRLRSAYNELVVLEKK